MQAEFRRRFIPVGRALRPTRTLSVGDKPRPTSSGPSTEERNPSCPSLASVQNPSYRASSWLFVANRIGQGIDPFLTANAPPSGYALKSPPPNRLRFWFRGTANRRLDDTKHNLTGGNGENGDTIHSFSSLASVKRPCAVPARLGLGSFARLRMTVERSWSPRLAGPRSPLRSRSGGAHQVAQPVGGAFAVKPSGGLETTAVEQYPCTEGNKENEAMQSLFPPLPPVRPCSGDRDPSCPSLPSVRSSFVSSRL